MIEYWSGLLKILLNVKPWSSINCISSGKLLEANEILAFLEKAVPIVHVILVPSGISIFPALVISSLCLPMYAGNQSAIFNCVISGLFIISILCCEEKKPDDSIWKLIGF